MEVIEVPFEALRTRPRARFNATTLSFPFRPQAIIRNPRLMIPKMPKPTLSALLLGTVVCRPFIATVPIAIGAPRGRVLSLKRALIRAGKRDLIEVRTSRLRSRDFRLALRYLSERRDTVGNVAVLPIILEAQNEEHIRHQDQRFFRRTDWWSMY